MIYDCIQRGLLVRETTKEVSFGHLTYQEFLVAKYLCRDNPVGDILEVLDKPWWQKTIQFYTVLQKDITRLLRYQIQKHGTYNNKTQILQDLVKLAPLTNKRTIEKLISLPREIM